MKKLKTAIVVMLSACMLLGTTTTCFAAESYIKASATKNRIYATYVHEKYGQTLQLEMYYLEKHKITKQYYHDCLTTTRVGNFNTVSNSKYADTGYEFKELSVYAYVNGDITASKSCLIAD